MTSGPGPTARPAARSRSSVAPLRGPGTWGLVLLVPAVLLVTLWPTHALLRVKPAVTRGLGWLHDRGAVEWLTWVRLEVLANVAMLVPLALALTLALGARRWVLAVAACAALSAGVELVQSGMPGRIASPLDVIANTLGALAGAALGVALEAAARRARRARLVRAAEARARRRTAHPAATPPPLGR